MLLKSEGHTTTVRGILPHMHSWVHKIKHGEGLQASPALNAMTIPASRWGAVIEGRAAENYAKHYKKLMKDVLEFRGRQVTARERMVALFRLTRFAAPPNFDTQCTNEQLGMMLDRYCVAVSPPRPTNAPLRAGGQITPEMVSDLRELATTLRGDGQVRTRRVFREIRVSPAEVDRSVATFCASPD